MNATADRITKCPKSDVAARSRTRANRHWTRQEDQRLGRLFGAGLDDGAIAKRLGRSLSAVESRRHRIDLRRAAPAPAMVEPVEAWLKTKPCQAVNPIDAAIECLDGRARRTRFGFLLDDRPCNARDIVIKANGMGASLAYPGVRS
ncbi:MAG: hypothetical protein QF926_06790 [Alphaproteobacteria bacterium]|mgnify:CR=1 FL=1|jgi:hypothetical protein|nr:hypothetical protein [Alphaproteobacteria bacterium]